MNWVPAAIIWNICVTFYFVSSTTSNLDISQFLQCDNDFCSRVECEQISCTNGTEVKGLAGPCNCCSLCIEYAKFGDRCDGDLTLGSDYFTSCDRNRDNSSTCGPDLKCQKGKCAQMNSNELCCNRTYDNKITAFWQWKPECDAKGDCMPKQCKGTRCYCRSKQGTRIYGKSHLGDQDEQTMNCVCSLMAEHLHQRALKTAEFDHVVCRSNGNYITLQCLQGLCFCVNETTGEVDGKIMPETIKHLLPCYDETIFSSTHERACQKQRKQEEPLAVYYFHKDFDILFMQITECEADGGFKAKQCGNADCYCVDPDGIAFKAPNSAEINAAGSMNCHCRRDKWESESVSGSSQNLIQCESNGNYKPLQCSNNQCWCVDDDGDQTSEAKTAGSDFPCVKKTQ